VLDISDHTVYTIYDGSRSLARSHPHPDTSTASDKSGSRPRVHVAERL
jgi:hypothetical protein